MFFHCPQRAAGWLTLAACADGLHWLAALALLAVLNRGVFIAGTRVAAKQDTGGGGSYQRKSFGPGARAPRGPRPGYPARNPREGGNGGGNGGGGKRFTHPDKWGRKPRGAEDDRD